MDRLTVPTLELSGAQFRKNLHAVRERIAPSQLLLAMKDDAYGHGVEWVMDAVGDAQDAPVAIYGGYDLSTSLRIRARAAQARVFAWATSPSHEIDDALRARIELGVGTADYLSRVIDSAARLGETARVHLKIDTGLHRNGVRPEDWPAVVAQAMAAERAGHLAVVGVWSHLAEASDAEDDTAATAFRRAVRHLIDEGGRPQDLHLTASAASWWRPELRGTVSRIGAFCYGIRSADGPQIPGVAPIATLRAPVLAVDTGSVEVGIGALHGLPSTLSGVQVATAGGLRTLHRIGATTSTVEAWDAPHQGEQVTIFGPGGQGESDATALAERIDTVGEEILTRLTDEVKRVSVD